MSSRLLSGDGNANDLDAVSRHSNVRLDTSWQLDLPDPMLSLTVGDTLTGALSWSRATRIGGVRLSRNFSLQPYRITAPLASLMLDDPEYRFDVLEIRHALDGTAAWHAAMRAMPEDKDRLRDRFDHMISLHGTDDPVEEARADAAFHLAIAEASHNLVLLQVTRALFDLLQANISQNLEKLYLLPRVFEPLSAQHRELMDAIVAGDAARARAAAYVHIDFVHTSLKSIDEDEARKARAFRSLPEKAQTP